jgi:hypothetical protein
VFEQEVTMVVDSQSIIVSGCDIDLEGKDLLDLPDFSLSQFIISIPNVGNPVPPLDSDTSAFTIEVF